MKNTERATARIPRQRVRADAATATATASAVSPAAGRGLGGVQRWPMIRLLVPALLLALVALPAVIFGWVGVAIASHKPIPISVSGGTVQGAMIAASTDVGVTSGLRHRRDDDRAEALIDASRGEFDGLCLRPQLKVLPFVDAFLTVRISTDDDVRIGRLSLAADTMQVAGIDLETVHLGHVAGAQRAIGQPGAGAFTIQSPGTTTLTDLNTRAAGIVIEDGFRLNALSLRGGSGDSDC